MRRTICVKGRSMEPTLVEGEYLSCNTSRKARKSINVGDIIVFKKNGYAVIKRVTKIFRNAYFVVGDNKNHSTDSRQYGSISYKDVIGVVDVINGEPIILGKNNDRKLSFKNVYANICMKLGV